MLSLFCCFERNDYLCGDMKKFFDKIDWKRMFSPRPITYFGPDDEHTEDIRTRNDWEI